MRTLLFALLQSPPSALPFAAQRPFPGRQHAFQFQPAATIAAAPVGGGSCRRASAVERLASDEQLLRVRHGAAAARGQHQAQPQSQPWAQPCAPQWQCLVVAHQRECGTAPLEGSGAQWLLAGIVEQQRTQSRTVCHPGDHTGAEWHAASASANAVPVAVAVAATHLSDRAEDSDSAVAVAIWQRCRRPAACVEGVTIGAGACARHTRRPRGGPAQPSLGVERGGGLLLCHRVLNQGQRQVACEAPAAGKTSNQLESSLNTFFFVLNTYIYKYE